MELILLRDFEHKGVTKPKTSKSMKKGDCVRFSSYCYTGWPDEMMYIGLSNGKIYYYKKRNMDQRSLLDRGKEHELIELESKQGHKGDIRRIIYTKIEDLDVLITGSADRTIKLWEPKNLKTTDPFQTIIGHDGSILDMVYIEKVQLLVTSSTDMYLKVWRLDKARKLLMYPWFVKSQTISDFDSNPKIVRIWLNCFDYKITENLELYVGDSEGSIYTMEAPSKNNESQDCYFRLTSKQVEVHRIGVIQILIVPRENLIFTIGRDQTLKWFEATNFQETNQDSQQVTVTNPNKCVYTHLAWHPKECLLYAADEKGYLYVINVYQEDKFITKRPVKNKINSIEIFENLNVILLLTDYGIKSLKIKQEVKQQSMAGHGDASVLKVVALEPHKIEKFTEESIPDTPKVLTAALDNTIVLWNYEKMEIISQMQAPKNSELSCMTFLFKSCLVATGHEDGEIRLWNMEINSSVLLKAPKNKRHSNLISCIHGTIWNKSEFLLAGSYDGKVSIWEITEKKPKNDPDQHQSTTILPQIRHLIDNSRVEKKSSNCTDLTDEVLVLNAFEWENECYILVGGNNQNIQVYSVRTGLLFAQLEGHTDSVTCFLIDGNMLMSGSDDCSILQWNLFLLFLGKEQEELIQERKYRASGKDSPDMMEETKDEMGGYGGSEEEEQKPLRQDRIFLPAGTIGHHTDRVRDLLLLNNGLVVSCGQEQEIMIWKNYQGAYIQVGQFKKQEELNCLDFVQETNQLLIGTGNGLVLTQNISEYLSILNQLQNLRFKSL